MELHRDVPVINVEAIADAFLTLACMIRRLDKMGYDVCDNQGGTAIYESSLIFRGDFLFLYNKLLGAFTHEG